MPKNIIHVNRQMIARDVKEGTRTPAITIQRGSRKVGNAFQADIKLPDGTIVASVRYQPCGARAWIETELDVVLHQEG
jgi:hypothetical protein